MLQTGPVVITAHTREWLCGLDLIASARRGWISRHRLGGDYQVFVEEYRRKNQRSFTEELPRAEVRRFSLQDLTG
jgi:hypothetical protein